jgi:hypothetical protein
MKKTGKQRIAEARKTANQVRLTLAIAQSRKEWADRWDELRAYAGKASFTYCARRLKQYDLDQIAEVRDEVLSESWRLVCNGERAEKAIEKTANSVTYARQCLERQSRELPDLPAPEEREPEYISPLKIRAILRMLPKRTRRLAAVIMTRRATTIDELADEIGRAKQTVYNYLSEIRQTLQINAFSDFLTVN